MPPKRIEQKLAKLTRQFFAKNPNVRLIAVTGSTGKTSAKIAIATILSQKYKIQLREEEPKTKTDVFMQIMGVTMPASGPFKWRKVVKAFEKRVEAAQPEIDLIVQEFSPQDIGYNGWFKDYLLPDIAVITSVTEGRMRVEHTIEDVAQEMITLANNSKMAIINRDDIEGRFASYLTNPNITTYGTSSLAEYHFEPQFFLLEKGHRGTVVSPESPDGLTATIKLLGEHNIRPAMAASAIGQRMGLSDEQIISGVESLRPLPGRMNMLRGAGNSWLIDDSYSSSPSTALSALQTLYSLETPQRIAVFGTMNGLRTLSEKGHNEIGNHCAPDMLDWVVTVGDQANQYLAAAARQKGCQVKECADAIEAGAFVREKIKNDCIVLFKGSSGGVWLEESIKINLYSASDTQQLVRQEPHWLERKQSFFTANRLGGDKMDTYNQRYRKGELHG